LLQHEQSGIVAEDTLPGMTSAPPDRTRLRAATAADVEALAALHSWSWQVTYGPMLRRADRALLTVDERRRLWERVLLRPADRESTFVAESVAGDAIGLIFVGPSEDHDAAPRHDIGEVHAIHVAPPLHGRGLGARLLAAGEAAMRENGFETATLWVIRENAGARAFYERQGWQPDGATKRGPMGGFEGLPVVDEVRYARRLDDQNR
jgi:GNAT superfamily N-acetyltransferase